jgi:hypothetical protein
VRRFTATKAAIYTEKMDRNVLLLMVAPLGYSLNTNYLIIYSVGKNSDNEVIFSYDHQSNVNQEEENRLCAIGMGDFCSKYKFS